MSEQSCGIGRPALSQKRTGAKDTLTGFALETFHLTQRISGLREIIDQFDFVLIDQFGVLHDGKTVFDGAIDCLKALRTADKQIVALTNSGRTRDLNIRRLAEFGFTEDLIGAVVTSGDLARDLIRNRVSAGALLPGDAVLNLSRDRDQSVLDGFGFDIHEAVSDDTKFVLISGVVPENRSRDEYREMLAPLARKGVPAICANPDHMMYADGTVGFGPGLVAEDYQADGGPLEMVGKPFPEIFQAGLAQLPAYNPARTLMIGDSPHHDIAGGRAAGCQTLLISGGVQASTGTTDIQADYEIHSLVYS